MYATRELVACLELHTYSSLNKQYISKYQDALKGSTGIVYFNPEKVAQKKLEPITEADVKKAFGSNDVQVFTDSQKLQSFLEALPWTNKNLLIMSSGDFGGLNIQKIADSVVR